MHPLSARFRCDIKPVCCQNSARWTRRAIQSVDRLREWSCVTGSFRFRSEMLDLGRRCCRSTSGMRVCFEINFVSGWTRLCPVQICLHLNFA